MRSAVAVLLTLVLTAAVWLGIAAFSNKRSQSFMLGVASATPLALKNGQEACQVPIAVPDDADFEGINFAVGTGHRPGPRLDVIVRADEATGRPLARGTLPAGYPDVADTPPHTVWVPRVTGGRTVAVCVVNRGPRAAHLYTSADAATRASTGLIDGRPVGGDFAFGFVRREPQTVAALVPVMFERAALFRANGVGAWTYVVLALLTLVAVPALLLGALRAAQREG